GGRERRSEDQREASDHETKTADHEKNAQHLGEVTRSKDQIPEENGRHSIQGHEDPAAMSVRLQREQREAIQLVGRESLQIAGASEDEQRREVEELGGAEDGGRDEPEEHRQQGEIPAGGLEQEVEDKRQRDIADGLEEIDGETK